MVPVVDGAAKPREERVPVASGISLYTLCTSCKISPWRPCTVRALVPARRHEDCRAHCDADIAMAVAPVRALVPVPCHEEDECIIRSC